MKVLPPLDKQFKPACLFHRDFSKRVQQDSKSEKFIFALEQNNGSVAVEKLQILEPTLINQADNFLYVERIIKFLLWMKGGAKIYVVGCEKLFEELQKTYSIGGKRAFDNEFIGKKVYGKEIEFIYTSEENLPQSNNKKSPLGGHLQGNRIGFDLGGSDRKCAALINGEVVFSTEIEWNPYFENNPDYHIQGIEDSLKRAAQHLPSVDAIGGSAAGVYVDNEVRGGSLFRGVSEQDFEKKVRHLFFDLKKKWNNVPFEVVNDGEVTALAGAMALKDNAVLGVAMGTSQAAGYVDGSGQITSWLNELAFCPIDYRKNAPCDEWSQDEGCGVQYFSQQAVARLVPVAGIDEIDSSLPFPEQLVRVQQLMKKNDKRARAIYQTIGVYFGYAIAHYANFYEIKNLLILGRVTSGEGGEVIIQKAKEVLRVEFPRLFQRINMVVPNEKDKRHGQAIAAASLPQI